MGQPLSIISARLDWRVDVKNAARLSTVFAHCNRYEWAEARTELEELRPAIGGRPSANSAQLMTYLDGVIKQGMGNDQAALTLFQSPDLSLPSQPSKLAGAELDVRILSTINSILILQQSANTRPQAETLLELVSKYADTHKNRSIVSAAHLLRASSDPHMAIVRMKQHLSAALAAAKEVNNAQLLAIIMNLMVVRFFTGVVGEQAEKSARVGVQLSKKVHSTLLQAVSNRNLAECMELQGKREEAGNTMEIAREMMAQVPEGVKAKFVSDGV